jgi:transposase
MDADPAALPDDIATLRTAVLAERARADAAEADAAVARARQSDARFLEDGRVCITNNAAERGLRGIALGRKSWLFAGSDRGGKGRP